MSDLQLVLLTIAAALLAVLYLWSKWQERQALKQFEHSINDGVGDALLNQPGPTTDDLVATRDTQTVSVTLGAVEPSFKQVLSAQLDAGRREPTFVPRPAQSDSIATQPEVVAPMATTLPKTQPEVLVSAEVESIRPGSIEWVEDTLIDYVIELRCAHAVDGVAVFDAAAPLAQARLPLPVNLVAWDGRTQCWVRPDRFGFYTELLIAVQLAHRRVRLGQIEVARFLSAVEQVAMRLDADFDAPGAEHIQNLATQLGQTCARFDVQVGLTLESLQGAWAPAQLTRAAQACDLAPVVEEGTTRGWSRSDSSGHTLFTLMPASLLADRLLLELDVPLVPISLSPLRQMFDVARRLAEQLNARIVDDNGRPINDVSIDAIETQLQKLVDEMGAAGIEPGGARAVRLYGPLN